MALFYRNLWEKNLPPIEALRQAQLEIYRNPDKIAELAEGFRGKFDEVPGAGGSGDQGRCRRQGAPPAVGRLHPLRTRPLTGPHDGLML